MVGFLAALALAFATGSDMPPRVVVPGGTIEGSAAPGGGAILFRGIPYAAPPLGDLRWRAPSPVVPWQGVRADKPDAPACPQHDRGWNHDAAASAREDCLTLDIRTPSLTGKLPVMVWIHGGSNWAGSAHGMVQSRITDRGVVLVAIQYRLGLLGFLPHRGAAVEAGGATGNYGLLDQIAALKWVHDHIADFGGDPENITIFGESAGSQDVSLMLAAPDTRGLFAKAILESGTPNFGMPDRSLADGLKLGDQADVLLNTGGSIAELRKRPIADLLAADLKLEDPAILTNDFRWLRPTIDGKALPKSPRELLAEAPPRPVIVGTNRAEFGPGPGEVNWDKQLATIFGGNAAKAREFYRKQDPRLGHPELAFWTDWVFRCPAGRLGELLAGKGAPVWRYEFDLSRDGGRTSHAAEIPWVMDAIPFGDGVTLQAYWTNFAIRGDPNGAGLPKWPRFDAVNARHVEFNAQGVVPGDHLRQPICSMLEEL